VFADLSTCGSIAKLQTLLTTLDFTGQFSDNPVPLTADPLAFPRKSSRIHENRWELNTFWKTTTKKEDGLFKNVDRCFSLMRVVPT
jgi:hypothetical protein